MNDQEFGWVSGIIEGEGHKYDSSDLFGSLRVGRRYTCTYTGFRVPVFSSYRNIIGCHPAR